MAEVLGIVSSGFAVASLALQLVVVSQNLHTFWQSFEDADSDVESIKKHLITLRAIASDLAATCEQEPHIQCGDSVVKSLEACKARTEKLTLMIKNVGSDRRSGRWGKTWATFRTTLKEKTVHKIESQLGDDVMMLILALQPFFHRIQQNKIDLVNANITAKPVSFHNQNDMADRSSSKTSKFLGDRKNALSLRNDPQSALPRIGGLNFSQFRSRYFSFKVDSSKATEILAALTGVTIPKGWADMLRYYAFGLTYLSATHQLYLDVDQILLTSVKRRVRITLPITAFQLQASSIPLSITAYPIAQCQSQIFKFCLEGNIDMVKLWFQKSWTSPYVVNQHGENLLHTAARYAHAELCNLLLDVGVDGAAYDDRLLTPLDHLARKMCLSLAYPSQVVNTIRALVERGRCRPLLPVTSNAVAFYNGPEEGFAWLFSSEYAGVDLEGRDSENWTLLGDAAFNFGWWTEHGVADPAVSWQCLYLLRAGANPHATSCEGRLTPLDAFLRGCTRHDIAHAGKWLQTLSESGIDLHKYATEEQKLHHPEHLLRTVWDEELWRWIPTKQRLAYKFGESADELDIWLEDYDALSWFHCGRFDLDIFQVCSPAECAARWKKLNAREDLLKPTMSNEVSLSDQIQDRTILSTLYRLTSARWFQILATLAASHILHVLFISKH